MDDRNFHGIELLPETPPVKQLFILLHGAGARPTDLLPFANKLKAAYPTAAFLLPDAPHPFGGEGNGRQWFSISSVAEENRTARIVAAVTSLHVLVKNAQHRFNVLQSDTALAGFSQGATLALELGALHDGCVGRILAFSGRFAKLPEKAPELTTLHLLHGEDDPVIPVEHARAAYEKLMLLHGDATLDIASSVGHELHTALADRAIHRLQTCIPLRSWENALSVAQSNYRPQAEDK